MSTSAGEVSIIKLDKLPSKVMNNNVLVYIDFIPEDGSLIKTKGGLDIQLAGGTWQEASRVARYGEVVRVPSELKSHKTHEATSDRNGSASFIPMDYECDMELQEGDTVYFTKMASANAIRTIIGNKVYFLIHYSEIVLRVRENVIYPLNGNVLVSKVMEDSPMVKNLIIDFDRKQDKKLGVVKYAGKKNVDYGSKTMVDADVEVGDKVVFAGGFWTEVENDSFAKLDEELGFVQRCWIVAKI